MDDIGLVLDICEHLDGIHETVLYVNTAGIASSYVRLICGLDTTEHSDILF